MKLTQNQFKGTLLFLRINGYRNTATIIFNATDVILFKGYNDIVTVTCHGFVYTVVYNFIYKMMKTTLTG